MRHRFTDDDLGKRVVTPGGFHIGFVDRVSGDRALIERDEDADLTERVRALLGWEEGDEREIRDEHIERSLDGELHLRHY
jgi:hypothetical protein